MMGNNKKIPAIRFKGFNEAWEQRKLGDMGKTFTGLSGKTKDDFGHGDAEFVTYMNIFSNSLANTDQTENVEIDERQNEVQYGDIFFTTSSETPEEVGMSSVWLGNKPNVYLNSFCFGYRPTEKLDFYYMAYMLRSSEVRKKFLFLAQGISRYNISKTKVMEISVFIPKMEEQVVIGRFFSNLDNLITLHQSKCDKLIIFKKAMLEKMFPKNGNKTPEVRFEGFNDAWEQRKLDKEVEFYSGLTYSPKDVSDKGTFVLRSSNVNNGEIVDADNVYVNPEVVNSCNVKEGDIIVVVRNGSRSLIGKHAQIKRTMDNTVIGAFMTGVRSNQSEFINALMDTQQFNKEIEKNLGATINQITNRMFCEMTFMFPCKEEQKKIGVFFSNLDNLITLHQCKVEKLQIVKKSMLEKMFV